MRTLEDVFIKEFRSEVRVVGSKDIYSVPLPEVCKTWEVSGTEEYMVMGIQEEFYQNLNDKVVRKLPHGYVAKRRVIDKAKRSYKRNEDGSFVYQDYQVPAGSAVVLSHKNINLPYSRYVKDTPGFGYIDYMPKGSEVLFIYVLPKEHLYKVNQTALAISVKNMRNYQGIGFQTWDNGVIYIHVIPYSPNSKYIGSKILKTGKTLNYSKEIHQLSDYWEKVGLIPCIKLCALQNGENLCLKQTVTGYKDYNPIEPNPISAKEIIGSEGDVSNA